MESEDHDSSADDAIARLTSVSTEVSEEGTNFRRAKLEELGANISQETNYFKMHNFI